MSTNTYPGTEYVAKLRQAVAYLNSKTSIRPEILITLGSGLGDFVEEVSDPVSVAYDQIPHFPLSTVAGHQGRLIFGTIASRPVAVMQGRVHLYEGYPGSTVAFPLRAVGFMGARTFIVTNACGGINRSYRTGTLMMISNHIGLFSDNPSIGVYHPDLGEMFYDISNPYDPELRLLALNFCNNNGIACAEGVYVQVRGPAYETEAEVNFLRGMGADAVGMSTVPEVNAARQLKMRVLGISSVTNMAAGISSSTLNHEEVLEGGRKSALHLRNIISHVVSHLPA